MAGILSIQVSQPVSLGLLDPSDAASQEWITSFAKRSVAGPVRLYRDHLEGDGQADTLHHGGADKAVLMYGHEHYSRWSQEYPLISWEAGGFGENATVSEWTEATVCVGDVFVAGQTLLQVAQPRIPCWKISRRWQTADLTERVRTTGRTGWYLRVLREGYLEAGMELRLLDRPHPELLVQAANDLLTGRSQERALCEQFAACMELADGWRAMMVERAS